VARGGIPLRAEQRWPKKPARTPSCSPATWSVNEFLLVREPAAASHRAIHGQQHLSNRSKSRLQGQDAELSDQATAHREARRAPLGRLFQEAVVVGADAVVGAKLRERMNHMGARARAATDGGEVIEFTASARRSGPVFDATPPPADHYRSVSGQTCGR